jgi:hypothetical protein
MISSIYDYLAEREVELCDAKHVLLPAQHPVNRIPCATQELRRVNPYLPQAASISGARIRVVYRKLPRSRSVWSRLPTKSSSNQVFVRGGERREETS